MQRGNANSAAVSRAGGPRLCTASPHSALTSDGRGQRWGRSLTPLGVMSSLHDSRGAQRGLPGDSPALRRDQGVAHVQDAHIGVALHVLLPVHVVVLDHICGTEGAVQSEAPQWGGQQPSPGGHAPMIFFTISYMACSSSSNFRHRYFRRIRSPHRNAKPGREHGLVNPARPFPRPGAHWLSRGRWLCWRPRGWRPYCVNPASKQETEDGKCGVREETSY